MQLKKPRDLAFCLLLAKRIVEEKQHYVGGAFSFVLLSHHVGDLLAMIVPFYRGGRLRLEESHLPGSSLNLSLMK